MHIEKFKAKKIYIKVRNRASRKFLALLYMKYITIKKIFEAARIHQLWIISPQYGAPQPHKKRAPTMRGSMFLDTVAVVYVIGYFGVLG